MTADATSGDFPVIRPPWPLRVYVAGFTGLWCALTISFAVTAAEHGKLAGVIPLLFILAVGVTFGVRLFRMSITLKSDELVIRNVLRTRRVQRRDVEGFRSGAMTGQPIGRTIYALLRDGSVVPLDVAGRMYRFGRGRALLDERLALLERWRTQF